MIDRARANADRPENSDQRQPSLLVGDVAALAFPDRSFDLVVSTLSMRRWADPATGLAEIGRVLRPGARALIWDFRPVSGRICLDHATRTCPTRSNTHAAPRFGWSRPRHGAGLGGSTPSSGWS